MNKSSIVVKLNDICREVFEKDDLVISESTVAQDVDNWDSFNHVTLILRIEEEFKIKFALGELQTLKNVGTIINLIEKKLNDGNT